MKIPLTMTSTLSSSTASPTTNSCTSALQFLISQSNTTSESIPCIMKASIISLFALASSLVGVLAAPAAAPLAELEVHKKNDVAQAQSIVNDLSTTLQPMLAAISTCQSISPLRSVPPFSMGCKV